MVKEGNLDKAGIGFVFEVPVEKAVGFVEAHEAHGERPMRGLAHRLSTALRVCGRRTVSTVPTFLSACMRSSDGAPAVAASG